MRRLIVANLLVFAVLASACALAYYGWSYNAKASSREREQAENLLRAFAEDKVDYVEDRLVPTNEKVFAAIDLERPLEIGAVIRSQEAAVVSVFLLDDKLELVPSGSHSKRLGEAAVLFQERFLTRILPSLPLRTVPVEGYGHVHDIFDGEEFLFAFTRRNENGRDYYVVLETDLKYLVGVVFPNVFPSGRAQKQLYQVVDENGELVYGTPFTTKGVMVEVPFHDTVDRWRLLAAQRETGSPGDRGKKNLIDIVLISLALGGIVAGLGLLLLAMRRERKANELKSDFITNVSHELKTPLSIISMFGEMLALGRIKTPEQATEYAEIIWRESVRLARLIDNVLDFAKIERGKDVYEFGEGDVAEVALRAIELSQHRLTKAELTVETEIQEDLPRARLDANAYTLAVMNLVDNAIKYAVDGKRLTLRLFAENGRIVLEVRDFGPGIDPSEHDRIFERFYRARAVRLKPIRGSGIGLALVDHIARAHGGGTWVTSTVGEGSTFGLWIPMR